MQAMAVVGFLMKLSKTVNAGMNLTEGGCGQNLGLKTRQEVVRSPLFVPFYYAINRLAIVGD